VQVFQSLKYNNVTIAGRVLERIDAYANRHGASRLGALTATALQLLASQSPDEELREAFVHSEQFLK